MSTIAEEHKARMVAMELLSIVDDAVQEQKEQITKSLDKLQQLSPVRLTTAYTLTSRIRTAIDTMNALEKLRTKLDTSAKQQLGQHWEMNI